MTPNSLLGGVGTALSDGAGSCCQACGTSAGGPAVRRQANLPDAAAGDVPESVHTALAEHGQPLPERTRVFFASRFGRSLDDVRVHDGTAAALSSADIGARAYSLGQHIVFGAGHFRPGDPVGDRLIAHEIAHTLQPLTGGLTVRRETVSRQVSASPSSSGQCPTGAPADLGHHRGETMKANTRGRGGAVYVIWETWQQHDTSTVWLARNIDLWVHWRYAGQTVAQQAAVIDSVRRRVLRQGVEWGDPSQVHAGCAYAFGLDQETLDTAHRLSGEIAKPAEPPPPSKEYRSEQTGAPSDDEAGHAYPAFSSDLQGLEVQPIGSTGTYMMNVHWADAGGGSVNEFFTAYGGLAAQYTWEMWDISRSPSVQEAEKSVRQRMTAQGSGDPRGQTIGRAAGAARDLARAREDLQARPDQINRDSRKAIDEGRYADALGDEINRTLFGLGVLSRFGGELLGGLADVTGSDRSRRIPFTGAGVFVVRCIARTDGDPEHRRAPSVATKVVVTRSAEKASEAALLAPAAEAQEDRDRARILAAAPDADPSKIKELNDSAADKELVATGAPLMIINHEIARTEKQLEKVKAASALDQFHLSDADVVALQTKLDSLRERRKNLDNRTAELAAGGAAIRRVRAALVSTVTGETYQLLLEINEPHRDAGRWRCMLSDVTTPQAHMYAGSAPDTGDDATDKLAATRSALTMLAEQGNYGGGSLSYILPETPWLTGRSDKDRTTTIHTREEGGQSGVDGARARLKEVAAALAVLGVIVTGGAAGAAAGLLGAAMAAENIIRRWREGNLRADGELVGDVLAVLGAVAMGARAIGGLAVVERAGGGVILRATTMIAKGADTISTVGGIIVAKASLLSQMIEIAEAEANGLSPTEARRRRVSAMANALKDDALLIAGHMRSGAHETSENARGIGELASEDHPQAAAPHERPATREAATPHELPEPHGQSMTGANAGNEPPATPQRRPATPTDAAHERWTADMLESGLDRRPPPLPQKGLPPVKPGETRSGLYNMSDALSVYDAFRARAPGREVGIYRNTATGEYAVVAGRQGSVGHPKEGKPTDWTNVLHNHPEPDLSRTLRNPSQTDIHSQWQEANRSGAPVTSFIEHDLPGGGRAYTAVTTTPGEGRVTVRYKNDAGQTVTREYSNMAEYAKDWGSRKRYVTSGSNSYNDMIRDADEYLRNRRSDDWYSAGTVPGMREGQLQPPSARTAADTAMSDAPLADSVAEAPVTPKPAGKAEAQRSKVQPMLQLGQGEIPQITPVERRLPPSSSSFQDVHQGTAAEYHTGPDGKAYIVPPKGIPIYAPDHILPPAEHLRGDPRTWTLQGPLADRRTPFEVFPGRRPTSKTLDQLRQTRGGNKKRGSAAEAYGAEFSGGIREQTLQLPGGLTRRTDIKEHLIGGTLYTEVKNYLRFAGNGKPPREAALTDFLQSEIDRDALAMKDPTVQVVWMFMDAPPNAALAKALRNAGLPYMITSDRLPTP